MCGVRLQQEITVRNIKEQHSLSKKYFELHSHVVTTK